MFATPIFRVTSVSRFLLKSRIQYFAKITCKKVPCKEYMTTEPFMTNSRCLFCCFSIASAAFESKLRFFNDFSLCVKWKKRYLECPIFFVMNLDPSYLELIEGQTPCNNHSSKGDVDLEERDGFLGFLTHSMTPLDHIYSL